MIRRSSAALGHPGTVKEHHRLDRLQPEHVQRMHVELLAAGLSPASVLQAHRVLSRALKVAMQRGRVSRRRLHARLAELDYPGDLGGYLRQRYLSEGWAVLRIARELGIGNTKIKQALDDAGVVRHRPGAPRPPGLVGAESITRGRRRRLMATAAEARKIRVRSTEFLCGARTLASHSAP